MVQKKEILIVELQKLSRGIYMASAQMQQDNGDIGTAVLVLEMNSEIGLINFYRMKWYKSITKFKK